MIEITARSAVSAQPFLSTPARCRNDEGQFQVTVRASEGTSRESTALAAERIAADLRALPGVVLTVATIGDSSDESANEATLYVRLTDPEERKESVSEIIDLARKQAFDKQPDDLRISISESFGPGSGVEYTLMGPDLEQLGVYSDRIVEALKKEPSAVDVNSSFIQGKPEIIAKIDRASAADLGVSVSDIADTLRLLVGGLEVSTYAEGGEEYEIFLRADQDFRSDVEGLALVTVPSSIHNTVPLRDVVQVVESSGPASIHRTDRQRRVTVTANAALGYGQNEVQAAVEKIASQMKMPQGYQIKASGFTREGARTARAFLVALLLSVVFMYLVLAAQFESWIDPLSIMFALPLTVPFALLSILIFQDSLNIFSGLGLFVLFGIVKKNSILQIDHTKQLRRKGMNRLDAILEANKDRLRPILMTTISFVAGMLPLIFSRGIGAGQSRSIAGIVIGGQTFSLLLTLLAVPVIYSLLDDAAAWLKRVFFSRPKPDRGETELE